jgi:hypothetical protein
VTILNYSRLRLQIGAVIFAFSAFAAILRYWFVSAVESGRDRQSPVADIQIEWVFPILFLIAAGMVGRMLYLMNGDLAAIRALPEGLEVTSFFSRRLLPWDDLIGGHRVNYGNFLHRNRWFNIRYLIDGSNRTTRVPLILTKRPSGGQMSLPEKIDKAREEALGRPSTSSGERLPGTGVDPDAVIARYLKAKAEAAAAAPPDTPAAPREPLPPPREPVRPAFGRKGLG